MAPLFGFLLAMNLGCSSGSSAPPDDHVAPPAGEYLDDAGVCRRSLAAGMFGCADSYTAALAAQSACGVTCAGPAGDQLVFIDECTPTVGCAYDPQTNALVGAYFGDDVPSHCENSFSVSAGAFPATVEFNGFDLDRSCLPTGERNLSSVLDAALRRDPPPSVGSACRAGHDQCRGPVTALVCANDQGQVLADGTCAHCAADDDCRAEYRYADAIVTCGPAGHCVFGSEIAGSCQGYGAGCFTASAAFVCDDGLCGACSANDQCSLSGPYNLCLDGVCMHSDPQP